MDIWRRRSVIKYNVCCLIFKDVLATVIPICVFSVIHTEIGFSIMVDVAALQGILSIKLTPKLFAA